MYFPPPKLTRYRRCERCDLKTPLTSDKCKHCADLNEAQLAKLMEKFEAQQEGHHQLGLWMLAAACFLLILMWAAY